MIVVSIMIRENRYQLLVLLLLYLLHLCRDESEDEETQIEWDQPWENLI